MLGRPWVSGSAAAAATRLSSLGGLEPGQRVVQLGDDLEIGDQGAQLGGRAEIELGAAG